MEAREHMCGTNTWPHAQVQSSEATRRAFVGRLLALGLGVPSAAALLAGCGDDEPSMMGGSMGESMPDWMMGGDSMDRRVMTDMEVIRDLLINHNVIERRVQNIAGGVLSVTASSDDRLAERIQAHVWQMKERIEDGDVIRRGDPLFREIFEHHVAIRMEIQNIDHGVEVTETPTTLRSRS